MVFTVEWGIGDVVEGTEPFDTREEALNYVEHDFELTDEQAQRLRESDALTFASNIGTPDAVEWVRITDET